MKSFFKLVTFIIIWGVLLGGGYVFYEAHTFLKTPASQKPRDVAFSIAPGSTFDRVAWDLQKAGLITDVFRFRILAQYHAAFGKIKAGEFLLNTGWTPDKVLYQVTQGQAMLHRLSIREGLTWWETARTIEEQGFATYEDFKAVIHDPAFLHAHNIPFANAEGFLYPETYLLKKPGSPLDREQAKHVADVMVRTFWRKTEPIWTELPLRPDLRDESSSLPGRPLLPAQQGAMSSSPSLPSGNSVPAPVNSPVADDASDDGRESGLTGGNEDNGVTGGALAEKMPGRSQTLDGGGVRTHLGTALPDAKTVLQPTGPAPEQRNQGGWQATIAAGTPTAGLLPHGTSSTSTVGTVEPVQNGTLANSASLSDLQVPAPQQEEAAPASSGVPDMPAGASMGTDPAVTGIAPAGNGSNPADESGKHGGPRSPGEVDPKALQRLITLASLVEKETGVPTERARVAGVYANRLRLKMLLQCDPTIIYGVGPSFSGAIRRSQLDDPRNLYNTYQHPGLTPGPICSPGLASLQAAHMPEAHDFLYFVVTGRNTGHTFSKTLNEHNKAVQVYRERMRSNGGKGKQ